MPNHPEDGAGAEQTLGCRGSGCTADAAHTPKHTPPAGWDAWTQLRRQTGKGTGAQVHACADHRTQVLTGTQRHTETQSDKEKGTGAHTHREVHTDRQTDRQVQQMHGHTAACTPGTHTGGFPWGDVHKQTHSPVRLRADTGSHVWQHRQNRNESTRRRVCTHTEGQGKDLGQGMSHAALWGSGTGAG